MEDTVSITLEELVDRLSLNDVLQHLANVCHAKATHLESAWQDSRSAREWTRAGHLIDKTALRITL